jgi:hypothetical protein
MAEAEENYLSAYLFASGTTDSYLSYAHDLVNTPRSGVHFVFPLVGAWDSMTVLEAAPGDLEAIRRLVIDLTGPRGDGSRLLHTSVAFSWPPWGRIKKRLPLLHIGALVAMKTGAGIAQALFEDLQAELSIPNVEVLVERVNGRYDLVGELAGRDLESTQGAVEELRATVGDRATLDAAFAAF